METLEKEKESVLSPLFEKFEQYAKTNLELVKLKSAKKTGEIVSNMVFKLTVFLFLSFFVMVGTVALALYIGSLLGASYYGFAIMAGFYGLVTLILFASKGGIKATVKKSIVNNILN